MKRTTVRAGRRAATLGWMVPLVAVALVQSVQAQGLRIEKVSSDRVALRPENGETVGIRFRLSAPASVSPASRLAKVWRTCSTRSPEIAPVW